MKRGDAKALPIAADSSGLLRNKIVSAYFHKRNPATGAVTKAATRDACRPFRFGYAHLGDRLVIDRDLFGDLCHAASAKPSKLKVKELVAAEATERE